MTHPRPTMRPEHPTRQTSRVVSALRVENPPTTHAHATRCWGSTGSPGGVMWWRRIVAGWIDRRVFAEMGRGGGMQAVKVPSSDAVWSAWRRYCEPSG
jgi:hypothetical protein